MKKTAKYHTLPKELLLSNLHSKNIGTMLISIIGVLKLNRNLLNGTSSGNIHIELR